MGVHIHQHPTRESDLGHSSTTSEKDEAAVQGNNENVVHKEEFYAGNSIYAKLHQITGRWGVEERGIERLPSDERDARKPITVGITWFSINMTFVSLTLGVLPVTAYGLSFVDAAILIIAFNFLGSLPVALFSSLGPVFGLRQIPLSRFYFGYHGAKLAALINVAVCVSSSAINAVVGAQLFHGINPRMPGWAGILIVSLTTLVICTMGHRFVHTYERYSWLPCFVVLLIVLGVFAHSGNFDPLLPLGTGTAKASGVLSFAASVYTFTAGWAAYAADYSIYQPADPKPSARVFWWTFAGNFFPTVFTELLGAAVMTATVHHTDFAAAYDEAGLGGVFSHVLIPAVGKGFGTFCVVLLALSIIGTNIATVYSVSMSVQVLGRRTQRVPRFLWTLVSTVGYTAFAIPAYQEFATYLENLLLAMSYWISIYLGITLTEHFLFRRGVRGYQPEAYTDAKRVAVGIAQEWYRGPVIKAVGEEFVGDLGCVFGFLFTTVSYMVLRYWEKRYFGR
ncbi:permease for cytosine/purines, uracil, thiamine, allantoin-domain-containing protein [Neurospora tetraspora]|uniref:Permease for cytosine/purines, uracil, thiamine, allantoin-domain-containing protein n=1 Tax=Neurospora tetraspora TaxID=94610 RepID=A0AAE0JMB2_9PEZI|nr:permease for cytosine/purines, uracil, thiamine, allantoin-domain-containing protein [Neurospora tetraspora]